MATTLEQLAAGLMGADTQKEIAAANPYYGLAGVGTSISDLALKAYAARKDATQNDLWQAAAIGGAGGLLSGLLKGFGNDYQDKLTNRYVNLAMGYQQPTTADEAGLPQGLFGSAVRQSALFQRMKELQAAEDLKDVMKAEAIAAANVSGQMKAYEAQAGGLKTGGSSTPSAAMSALNPIVKEGERLKERGQDTLDNLRKEFNALPEVKDFVTVERSAKILKEAVADPSSVADQELVRYAILLIEPGMAVREGEQAAVAKSQSIPDAIRGELGKALRGEAALGASAREGLLRLAERSYVGHSSQYSRALDSYSAIAKSRSLDPALLSRIGTPISAADIFKNAVIAGADSPLAPNNEIKTKLIGLRTKALSGQPLTADEWAFINSVEK